MRFRDLQRDQRFEIPKDDDGEEYVKIGPKRACSVHNPTQWLRIPPYRLVVVTDWADCDDSDEDDSENICPGCKSPCGDDAFCAGCRTEHVHASCFEVPKKAF